MPGRSRMFSSEKHSFRSCKSMLLLFRSEEKGGELVFFFLARVHAWYARTFHFLICGAGREDKSCGLAYLCWLGQQGLQSLGAFPAIALLYCLRTTRQWPNSLYWKIKRDKELPLAPSIHGFPLHLPGHFPFTLWGRILIKPPCTNGYQGQGKSCFTCWNRAVWTEKLFSATFELSPWPRE